MGTRYVPDRYRGIVRPDPLLEVWDDETGYFNAGGIKVSDIVPEAERAGVAVPDQSTDLALRASGDQTEDIEVYCNRRGLPGVDEMSYLWRKSGDGATKYRGCDLPVPAAAWLPIDTTNARLYFHAVSTPDGYIVECFQDSAGDTYTRTMSPDDQSFGAEVTVDASNITNGYPCLCVVPRVDGYRIMLYRWSDTGGDYNVRAWHSDDQGATWTDDGFVLVEDFDAAGVTSRHRLRAAYLNGQVLLVAHVLWNDTAADIERDRIIQWASSDGGGAFTHVLTSDGTDTDNAGAWIDLTTWRGEFVLGRLVYDSGSTSVVPAFRRLSTAWYPWTSGQDDGSPTALTSAQHWGVYTDPGAGADQYIGEGELALWCDDLQTLYAAGRHCAGGDDGGHPVLRSIDGADTWTVMGQHTTYAGNGSMWWNPGGATYTDPNNELSGFCGVHQRGRGVIITTWRRNAGAITNYHAAIFLGGAQTVPMPPLSQSMSPQRRTAWDLTGAGMFLPNESVWTRTVIGGGSSQTLTAGRVVNVADATPGSVTDTYNFTATIAEGAIFETSFQVATGGNHHLRLKTDDGAATDYDVEVRISDTQISFWDLNGAQIGTTDTHGHIRIRVRISLHGNNAACWYRGDETVAALGSQAALCDPDRDWTLLGSSGSVTNGGGGGGNLVSMSTQTSSTVYIDEWHLTAGPYCGIGLDSQPDRLKFGRSLIESPSWTGHGLKLSAVTGPAAAGESWTVDKTADYPIPAMLPTVSPSPRHPHWATDLVGANGTYRWSFQRSANVESAMSIRWAALLDGLNMGGVEVYLYYSGAWNLAGSLGYWTATCSKAGDTLTVTSGGTLNTAVIRRDELVGCHIEEISGGAVAAVTKVIENAPGHMDTGAGTSLPLRIRVDDASGMSATPTVRIYPRRALLVFDLEALAVNIRGIQIRVAHNNALGATTPPAIPIDDRYEIATFAAGPVWAWGWSPSHGRRLTTEVDVELTEAEDGTAVPYQRKPARRVLEWTWAEGVPMEDVLTEPDPDYTAAKTAGAALAFRRDAPQEISDQLRALSGALTPVVVVPRIDQGGSGRPNHWADGAFLARITGTADLDGVRGDEEYSEQARIQGLRFEEVV